MSHNSLLTKPINIYSFPKSLFRFVIKMKLLAGVAVLFCVTVLSTGHAVNTKGLRTDLAMPSETGKTHVTIPVEDIRPKDTNNRESHVTHIPRNVTSTQDGVLTTSPSHVTSTQEGHVTNPPVHATAAPEVQNKADREIFPVNRNASNYKYGRC